MTLEQLEKAATRARKDFRRAEAKAEELQREVQAAKTLTKKAPLQRRQPLEGLKRAVRAALAAEEQVRDLLRAWEQAQQRLASAMHKTGTAAASNDARSPSETARLRKTARPRVRKTALSMLRSHSSASRAAAGPDQP